MKKVIFRTFLVVGTLFTTGNLFAQSFSVQSDTVRAVVYNNLTLSSKVTNISTGTIKVGWQVTAHTLPNDWQSIIGICDNQACWGNTVLGTSTSTPAAPPYTPPGIAQLSDTFGPGGKCDFHLQGAFSTASSGGPFYITVKLTEGTTTKYMTFALTKWATGISSTTNATKEVSVYPNPARDEVNVVYDKGLEIKNISVVNLIGKVVKYYRATDDSGAKLNIDNMASGVYLINLIDAQGHTVATKRFAVIQ
jgi:hypothetical protein